MKQSFTNSTVELLATIYLTTAFASAGVMSIVMAARILGVGTEEKGKSNGR